MWHETPPPLDGSVAAGTGQVLSDVWGIQASPEPWRNILDLSGLVDERPYIFDVAVTGCSVEMRVNQRHGRATKTTFYTVARDGGAQIPLTGSCTVFVRTLDQTAGILRGSVYLGFSEQQLSPAYSKVTTQLVAGVLLVPGVWTVTNDIGGRLPENKTMVDLACLQTLDARYVDNAGLPVAQWTITGHELPIAHPPGMVLQVRHPGGGADSRSLVASWRTGGA